MVCAYLEVLPNHIFESFNKKITFRVKNAIKDETKK